MKNFSVLNKLGEGAFSTVYKVRRLSDNKIYALKKVSLGKLTEKEKQNALNEVRILASIQNENIISYKEAFMENHTSTLCIVMEFADGGDLLQKITKCKQTRSSIPEEEVWSIFIQLLKGLQALHELKIVHRDIKCANLFLTKDGILKLGDLNVSKVAQGMLKTQTGTPYYASPEVWQDKPYDLKSDIWSVGCVLYETCALVPPFTGKDMQGLFRKICEGIVPALPMNYSRDLNHMVKLCLQQQPKLRPNCFELLGKSQLLKNLPSKISVQLESQVSDVGLIGTIKVPINLQLINERLPTSNYAEVVTKQFNRQISMPNIPQIPNSSRAEGRHLQAIPESRDEIVRSADFRKTRSYREAAHNSGANRILESKVDQNRPAVLDQKYQNEKENNSQLPSIANSLRRPHERDRLIRNGHAILQEIERQPVLVRESVEIRKSQPKVELSSRPHYGVSPTAHYRKGDCYAVNAAPYNAPNPVNSYARQESSQELRNQRYQQQQRQAPSYRQNEYVALTPAAGLQNRYQRY